MKKTLIATLIMAVALMMTLSGAVFAASALTIAAPAKVTEGADVAVTITYPADVAGYEYKVAYNADVLEYVSGGDSATGNTVKLANIDPNYNAVTSSTLNFKAKAEGSSEIKVDGDIKLVGTDASKITDATANTVTVTVAKAEEPAPVEENKGTTDTTETNSAEDTTATTDKDATKKSLKDTKTGFDAMYIVYLAAAVVVAGGVVAVARRK